MHPVIYTSNFAYDDPRKEWYHRYADWQSLAIEIFHDRLSPHAALKIIDESNISQILQDNYLHFSLDGFWSISALKLASIIDFIHSPYTHMYWIDLDTYVTTLNAEVLYCDQGKITTCISTHNLSDKYLQTNFDCSKITAYEHICKYMGVKTHDVISIPNTWYMSMGKDSAMECEEFIRNIPSIQRDLQAGDLDVSEWGNEHFLTFIINHICDATNVDTLGMYSDISFVTTPNVTRESLILFDILNTKKFVQLCGLYYKMLMPLLYFMEHGLLDDGQIIRNEDA